MNNFNGMLGNGSDQVAIGKQAKATRARYRKILTNATSQAETAFDALLYDGQFILGKIGRVPPDFGYLVPIQDSEFILEDIAIDFAGIDCASHASVKAFYPAFFDHYNGTRTKTPLNHADTAEAREFIITEIIRPFLLSNPLQNRQFFIGYFDSDGSLVQTVAMWFPEPTSAGRFAQENDNLGRDFYTCNDECLIAL